MKKRWMNSVIKNSKTWVPALPFHRTARLARKASPNVTLVKALKTA